MTILLKPTIAIEEGDCMVVQCAQCGLLAATVTSTDLGNCPACQGDTWWKQNFDVGPFVAVEKADVSATLRFQIPASSKAVELVTEFA